VDFCSRKETTSKYMKKLNFKTVLFLVLMLVFILLAISSDDVLDSKLYASIALIIGACASNALSFKNLINNERNN
jgi:hypothetical protein